MIRLGEIEYLIRLGVYSPFVRGERSVSMVLCAPSEHGKSEILKKFINISTVKISSNFDTTVFLDIVPEIELRKLKTLMILDFLRVTKRKYSTQANSLTILSALIEEGWHGNLPLGRRVDKPIRANLITALTEDDLRDKRHKWAKTGFLSRLLPITYRYRDETKSMIREYIKDRKYIDDTLLEFELPPQPLDIELPHDIANKLESISLDITNSTNLLGFRLQRQLQVLAMSNALMSGRIMVTEDDYKVIKRVSKHINFRFNAV